MGRLLMPKSILRGDLEIGSAFVIEVRLEVPEMMVITVLPAILGFQQLPRDGEADHEKQMTGDPDQSGCEHKMMDLIPAGQRGLPRRELVKLILGGFVRTGSGHGRSGSVNGRVFSGRTPICGLRP